MIDRISFSDTMTDDFYHLSGRGEYCYLSVSHLFVSQTKSIKEFYHLNLVNDNTLSNGSLSLTEGGEGIYLIASTDIENLYAIEDYVEKSNELLEYRRATLVTNANRDTPKRVTKSRAITRIVPRDLSDDTFSNDGNLMLQYEVKGKYVVTVVINNALKYIQDNLAMTHTDVMKVNFSTMRNILSVAIKNGDMLINCTCPDYCLHGDTLIKLLDGRTLPVSELANEHRDNPDKDLWVYSTDESGDFKPGHVSDIWVSGKTDEYIEVTLDNGKVIKTTPNHPYMLRDGSYIRADKLIEGQSLMPLYFSHHNGYEAVKSNSESTSKFYSTYKLVASELLQDQIEEAKIRSGESVIAINHKNFDKSNNDPSNLWPMGRLEHIRWHAHVSMQDTERFNKFVEAGHDYWRTPEGRAEKAKSMSENIKAYWSRLTPEERSLRSAHARLSSEELSRVKTEYWKNLDDETRAERNHQNGISLNGANGEKASARIRAYWSQYTPEERSAIVRSRPQTLTSDKVKSIKESQVHKLLDEIVANGEIISEETYESHRMPDHPKYCRYQTAQEKGFLDNYNHRIVSIRRIILKEPEDVYDIAVDKYHNFYVDAGVMLHNCYRFAYKATKQGYKYGNPETRPARITNPQDRGSLCKHCLAVLYNNIWIYKMIPQLIRLIRTMPDKFYSDSDSSDNSNDNNHGQSQRSNVAQNTDSTNGAGSEDTDES